ncbi:MAG: hypothetical protein HFG90_00765 [Acholeplasmatales bacterium]|nr:hypothetical protein [Acholeplasmatales bacterium]
MKKMLGFEVSNEIYNSFNVLYMNCNLNKQDFVKKYKNVIKDYKKKPKPFKKVLIGSYNRLGETKTPNGAYYYAYDADLIDVDIKKGKPIVTNLVLHNGDGLCLRRPDYYKDYCIIRENKVMSKPKKGR